MGLHGTSPTVPMVQWDGMDSRDTGVVSRTTWYIPFSPNGTVGQ